MIRLLLLWISIIGVSAYPRWFLDYVELHKKSYTSLQRRLAFQVLKPKHDHIQKHTGSLLLELHSHSDKRFFKKGRNLMKHRRSTKKRAPKKKHRKLGMPLTFDWRHHGMVTPVRNQGECGGCYCFSALDHLEYWWKKNTGSLVELSVQECLDCTRQKIHLASGCDGGLMEDVFLMSKRWPIGKKSFETFSMRDQTCPRLPPPTGIKVKSFETMSNEWHSPIESELAHNLIRYGPIPVGVDSKSFNFELYKRGILKKGDCGGEIDHAVTVVGFGIEHGSRYWIVKNSWGKNWGVDGYFYLERDHNVCGINSYSAFATSVELVL
jgi:C1A family cysteine protease